ncbi:MAG: S46 family peptidase [Planctomycetes bacterium]|nr:S46 family peptidase [Planctomycetota bacterium]
MKTRFGIGLGLAAGVGFASMGAITICNSARADEGMWLFTKPPTKMLKEKYGFEPDKAWLEHVQKSAVRFNDGGSGSFVSSEGLVMTNHHVGSGDLEKHSTPEKNLLKTGFYAKTRDEEIKCDDLELNVLWEVQDVTDLVKGAVGKDMSTADANTARRKKMLGLEKECEDASKKSPDGPAAYDCQVVTLYKGGKYHQYKYKRFTDVRIVMAPEQDAAFFGGDTDNFEYPRFDLDMCFFHVYEDGKPYKPEHYLKWSPNGAEDNELTFVAGHPGGTERLNTVDHLKFMRDVEAPLNMRRLWRREVQLETFMARNKEWERIAGPDFFGVQNGRKARTGILAGLQDPKLMQTKMDAEKKLRAAVDANPDNKGQWGGAWDDIKKAFDNYKTFYARTRSIGISGDLFNIARDLVRLADELPKPSPERLREYADSNLDSLYLGMYSSKPIYDDLEIDRIASSLANMTELLGGDDPYVQKALGGLSPKARAEQLVKGTKLKDVETRKAIAKGGTQAIAESKDPMIMLAKDLDSESRALRKRFEDEIEGAQRDAYSKIAAAKFAVEGEDAYPDATFTLRLAFGPIKGYKENGKDVPPFSNFEGMYSRANERKGQKGFDLPQRVWDRKDKLDLKTPLNFVSTADIIGGNSGSPVVNKKGEVVGLIFDGNIQSLILDLAYTEEQARAVAVDSRGIIEAMKKIYDAGPLADEILKK